MGLRTSHLGFDVDRTLSSVLSLRSQIPEDAFTASVLGTERGGNGVVIRENGLVLTIGYLITEAESVWLFPNDGRAVEGHVVAYDQETGFGLVQALGTLDLPTLELGSSADLPVGDPVIVAGHGGREHAINARVVAKREFAGYWEYLLDEAIFTSPPHSNWGGAALLAGDGSLRGIGSLFVQQVVTEEEPVNGNMIVPIDLLKPIIGDLVAYGRTHRPPRPWLGMYAMESRGGIVVAGLVQGGPAHQAGVELGDLVLEVERAPVSDMVAMFRRVWALGDAGTEIPLSLARDGDPVHVRIRSASRTDYLKAPRLH